MKRRLDVRPRISDELFSTLVRRLTERDTWLCRLLWEHRVFTTNQICELAFVSLDTAERRLLTLHQLRVVDRLRPFRRTGSAPFHYVLDEMGAAIVAAERGIDVAQLGYRRDRALAIAHNQRLEHLLATNGFFTSLAAHARLRENVELVEWWSERRCAATWGDVVRPDGFGRWRVGARQVDFFLEVDRGTEIVERVTKKLDDYQRLADATGLRTPVLFWFSSARREAEVRKRLHPGGVPTFTANASFGTSHGGPWLPTGSENRRLMLHDLH